MGIPAANGGYWGNDASTRCGGSSRQPASSATTKTTRRSPSRKSVGRIEGGGPGIGLCVDTGWLGTKGIDAESAIRTLGPLVRHVHVKDVQGRGVARNLPPRRTGAWGSPPSSAALKEIGYQGWYSWEDEPEDRNPMEIARADARVDPIPAPIVPAPSKRARRNPVQTPEAERLHSRALIAGAS